MSLEAVFVTEISWIYNDKEYKGVLTTMYSRSQIPRSIMLLFKITQQNVIVQGGRDIVPGYAIER